MPTPLPDANLLYALDWRKEDAASFFSSRSFDRAVMVAQWYYEITIYAGDPGSNPALGKKWSRDYPIRVDVPATPMLLDANLCY